MVQIIDQLLDYEITIVEAKEKLESMYIPTDTALGYAMSKYNEDIISSLDADILDNLKYRRDILSDFDSYKESDSYYKAFMNQYRNNDTFREYKDFMTEFNKFISELEKFKITKSTEIDLDFGSKQYDYSVNSSELNVYYHLCIQTDKDNKITWVDLSSPEIDAIFPLFACYTYLSMGFEIEDYDEFYEKYDLFSNEEIYENYQLGDYEITSMTSSLSTQIFFLIKIP